MDLKRAETALRTFALSFPEVWEDSPWGDHVFKVKKKIFLFLGMNREGVLSLSVKLPQSKDEALEFPFAKPTGYGLGKAGWVSAKFEIGDRPPLDVLRKWVDESYRAIAPKTLVRKLPEASR